MTIKRHADSTEKLFGYRAQDIHEWIDQYFELRKFRQAERRGFFNGFNPFSHRKYLHNRESLPEALNEFKEKYPAEIIKKVFLQHLRDDYRGYIPSREDFNNEEFLRKFHRIS